MADVDLVRKDRQVEGEKRWYAARCTRPARAVKLLEERGLKTYVPMATVRMEDGSRRVRPLIHRLLFLFTDVDSITAIERESRSEVSEMPLMWIYRYTRGGDIQPIGEEEFRLFKLITSGDEDKCEIYHKRGFKVGDRLRVKGGTFAGYEGYARRIQRNKHIVVEIEGICAIALPFIHPDLLEVVSS